MSSEELKDNTEHSEPNDEIMVCVAGVDALKNELLAKYIHDQTNIICCCKTIDHLTCAMEPSKDETLVMLLDCTNFELPDLWPTLKGLIPSNGTNRFTILGQIDPSWQIEHDAINMGVRGLLYIQQGLDLYPKAIKAVLDGELWYPRLVLENHLLSAHPPQFVKSNDAMANLTLREREILELLVSGNSNQDIADQLCISTHTVKTHIYNIYKKLNVTNRLQAAILAAKNT